MDWLTYLHLIRRREIDRIFGKCEFQAFRKIRWLGDFGRAAFRVVFRVLKGPLCSGYGPGCEGPRWMLERLGLTSEYAYIAVKRGRRSPYEDYPRGGYRGDSP